mmetsp:Transcript_4221/g.6175  ORF Transcript_4221/g.6175 Transcript_4221/m.6175 type:complete len:520 (-) Transcript_4221:99-1658(-)
MTDVAAVVAAASNSRGIGYAGQMPWRLPGDMKHFRQVTSSVDGDKVNAVVMGRKTWDSIPPKFRPLEGRTNVVLTRSGAKEDYPQDVLVASSLKEATEQLQEQQGNALGSIYIIGGGQVYEECIKSGMVDRVVYTEVDSETLPSDTKFDAFFPELTGDEWECRPFTAVEPQEKENSSTSNNDNKGESQPEGLTDAKSGIQYQFLEYTRKSSPSTASSSATDSIEEGAHVNAEEMQYLELCRDIIENGVKRGDRTGTGTLSKFGTQMRFSLRDNTLPLLTTKRTFWRGVAEELLWFISGNTNANDLAAKDIHIWDGNGSREFLDSSGLGHREVGDLGPVYGFQWRHFGAKYEDMNTDYTGKGVDQLAECIDKIKNNPEDRRIIMSAWNPADLELMALPPCHMFCQFYVDTEKGELSCQMYQRSADMGLGVPFNIASYALLTHMMAQACGLKAGDFVHTIGDAHVYSNHVDALKEQLERAPRAFPKLKMNPDKKDIDSFTFDDFEVVGYKPHKTIKMKMAV